MLDTITQRRVADAIQALDFEALYEITGWDAPRRTVRFGVCCLAFYAPDVETAEAEVLTASDCFPLAWRVGRRVHVGVG